jgi:hypothetical protein
MPEMNFIPQMAHPNHYNMMKSEYERNDMNFPMRDSYYEDYKPYYHPTMSHMFLNECSYTIEKKKMNFIADKVEVFFNELPTNIKEEISFGKQAHFIRR